MTAARTAGDSTFTGARTLNESELHEWGKRFGAALAHNSVVALSGELGAGKTRLAQAICAGFGVRDTVTSPTFALVHCYQSNSGEVYHVDLYRLNKASEAVALGLDEIVANAALTIIEWPERAEELVPVKAVRIRLEHVSQEERLRRVVVLS